MLEEELDLSKGSPNRIYLVLGALANNQTPMSQKELSKVTGFPISSVVDLIKKINIIHGMRVVNEDGSYLVEHWSPIYNPKNLIKLFKQKDNNLS
jgi:hypothetical protein